VVFERGGEALEQFSGNLRKCRVVMPTGDELNAKCRFNISAFQE
jgi:hypothetical protein